MTDAKPRAKKLRPGDFSVNSEPTQVTLGYDLTGRSIVAWDTALSKNLLLAGYGVRQTEWALASILRHFKQHGVPAYGGDFANFIGPVPKGTFARFVTHRGQAEDMLAELADREEPFVLTLAAGGNLLAPPYLEEAQRATASETRTRLLGLLERVLINPAGHTVFTTSRLYEPAALPEELLAHFPTYVLSSKILARDRVHVLRADQDADWAQKLIEAMSATHSLLLPAGEKGQEFENFHTPMR